MQEAEILVPSQRQDEWIRLEEKNKQALLEAECGGALNISTIEDLKRYLRDGPDQTRLRQLPRFAERLNPILDHLQSFASAITSASQYSPVTCLVWGGIQAIVESACAVSRVSEETLETINELQRVLPLFDGYMALFPGKFELQWALQDIFDDFMHYCVESSLYFRRGYSSNYIIKFFSSASAASLQRIRHRLFTRVKTFKEQAELSHREEQRQQQLVIRRHLGSELTNLPIPTKPTTTMKEVEFPVTTVTMYRNVTFTGRKDVLDSIETMFEGSRAERESLAADARLEAENFVKASTGPKCCVLSGLGGIGKTQIALEYTYRKRGSYDAIFWLQAEHDWTLSSTYATIADKLTLLEGKTTDEDGDQKQQLAVQKARDWLEHTDRTWLLVFDNVEDIDELTPYIPLRTNGKGDVIVTTQKQIAFPLADTFGIMSVKPFTRDDAAKLLFQYLQREPKDEPEEDVARELSDIVDGLPLAIATIGGYINQSGSDPKEYIETLKTSANAWTASAVGPVRQYEKNLETVFDIALRELKPGAKGLAGILAFLNPDHIPETIFTTAIQKKSLDFLKSKADLLEAVRELKTRQLVRRDTSGTEPYLSIHRTVQWNILLQLTKNQDHRWAVFQQAFKLIRDVLPTGHAFIAPSSEKWPKYQKFGPHVLSLRTHCLWPDPPIEMPINFAQVLSDMGTFMWHAGKLTEGEEALETALDIMDEQNVEDDNLRANVYELLGIMSSFEGVSERKYSMDLRHKALDARHKALDDTPKSKMTKDDEIQAFIVESDMAYAYVQQEDFDDAAKVMEVCIKQYEKWGPEDEIPYQYSQYYQIMGVCHMAAGKPVESIKSITHCADLLVKAGGVMHPMTQLMRFIAGYLSWHAGDKEKALEINESVLEARKKIVGEFSHFTLESYSTCGYLQGLNGDYEKARVYLSKCLERRRRSLWNEEGVARAQFRYAHVLRQLEENEEAEHMEELARRARDKAVEKYPEYVPKDGSPEAIHDQMVSIWAGRFTGKLKQPETSEN